MGASCDWSREHFTLDPKLTEATQAAFIKLFNDDLIYKGDRIINWCPRCASAISDLEVDHREQAAKLWYLKYPVKDSSEFITVATTRPETMLGDSAVAVNPADKRYQKLVGQTVILPLLDREIPIIADRRVDLEFGTGAVKVTPAHDHLDWEIGQEYKLPTISVINEKTLITENGGPYVGLKGKEARLKIIEDLQKLNLLAKEEDYQQALARCQRCNTVIEPLISKQWFVKMKPLAEKAQRSKTFPSHRFDGNRLGYSFLLGGPDDNDEFILSQRKAIFPGLLARLSFRSARKENEQIKRYRA